MPEEAPKRKVVKKSTKKVVTKKVARKVTRKAAPRRTVVRERRGMSFVTLAIIWLVLIGAATGALYYGSTDQGQINITERMSEGAGISITGDEVTEEQRKTAPSSLPNGGLVPVNVDTPPAPAPEPVVEEMASSTSETASSTDDNLASEDGETPDGETETSAEGEVSDEEPAVSEDVSSEEDSVEALPADTEETPLVTE